MYLIDTSIWIPALWKKGPQIIKDEVIQWLSEDLVSTNGMVKFELISGCKTEQELKYITEVLGGVKCLPIEQKHFEKAAMWNNKLLRQGMTVPVGDVLIATTAMLFNQTVVHIDAHFEMIAKVVPIKLISRIDAMKAWKAELTPPDSEK